MRGWPAGLRGRVLVVGVAGALAACVPPRAVALRGLATTLPLPRAELPLGHTRIRFRWRYSDPNLDFIGDGVARVSAPDSARLDFFVDQGAGSGYVLVFGDTLRAPTARARAFHQYLPAPPLLWAALGRFAVPPAPDTVIRLDGDTLRADIGKVPAGALRLGRGEVWRVAFVGNALASLERLSGGREREVVTRTPGTSSGGGVVRYERLGGERLLTLTQVRSEAVGAFDPSIWAHKR